MPTTIGITAEKLALYGIHQNSEIVYNPDYETLFNEETAPGLEGFERGQVTELGAVNVDPDSRRHFPAPH